ncbi:MAG: elongation factor P [Erysipelotrichaceae bacterium]|nr:elongation factor P [Erysipelotrichaceae bacterium]
MIIVNDLKPGSNFEYQNELYSVINVDRNKTAMRQMIVKIKVKNLRTGVINEIAFTGGDKVEQPQIDKRKMQFLYDDGESMVFMDTDTYDQVEIPKDRLEWESNFLIPNIEVEIQMFGAEVLGISLPDKVEMGLSECEQAVKGDTATAALKNAVTETGLQVKVPLFINEDDHIIVSTEDGSYKGRA